MGVVVRYNEQLSLAVRHYYEVDNLLSLTRIRVIAARRLRRWCQG